MPGRISTTTHFLKRDKLYEHEKPYSLRFAPPDGFPRANIKLERHDVEIEDVRNTRDLNINRDGIMLSSFETKMTYEQFDDGEVVKDIYLREVADHLKTLLGAQHVQIFEHTVRKRHETFPISTGEPYRYNQPTSIAHVDTTLPWAVAMARQLNPKKAEEITKHRIQCVNFWKPLVGPVKDWPLAFCDGKSIDPERDFEPCDLVYPDYVVENRQIYHSDQQSWFYVSDQMPNEAWIFLQSDTEAQSNPIPHTAFPMPDKGPDELPARESIEARALVYYGGFL